MKHVRSLFVSLSALLVAAASGCSVDLCDIDADCLNYPEAVCYAGHCQNTCYTQRDCDVYRNATSHDGEFCADVGRADVFVCVPTYDVARFCRYDSDCDVRNWEYCDYATNSCVQSVIYDTRSDTYGSCNTTRDCLRDTDTCYGRICMPRCFENNRNCDLGDYCSPTYDVCLADPNRSYDNFSSWGAGSSCHDDVDCKDGTTRCLYSMCYTMCHYSADCKAAANGVCDPYEKVCMYY